MKPAAFYARVSTSPQLEKFGPQVQREAAQRYAARLGLDIVQTYEDAITGTAARREALDRLLTEAVRYQAVIISSVDRLARRVPIAYGVLGELAEAGLELHSADMGLIDLDDESSSMQFGIRSLFADVDHRRISKRLEASRVSKVQGGSPVQRLNGYGWRQGVRDEAEAAWVVYMYQQIIHVGARMLVADLTARGVRTRHGAAWGESRLRSLLQNPTYKGQYQYGRRSGGRGRVKAVCQVEALVSPELWAAAQDAMSRRSLNTGRRGGRSDVYPLQGRLTCAECGRAIGGNTTIKANRPYHYYGCADRCNAERTCTHRKLYPAASVHAFVRGILEEARENPASLAELVQRPAPAAPDLATMHAAIDRKLSRLEAAYDAGAYTAPEYAERRAALKREREALSVLEAPTAQAPADLAAVQAAVGHALSCADLLDVAEALNLRGVLGSGGELTLSLNPL
ncbi:recombinase family protein [Deinococcus alpinitundrae]|uniref:recombinase family protein n=1 Tax=Deinococcus alpinitundrae TaxID=468913 RepID=UPI00137A1337|nr:recombinase family protein [Deinococcus alpinitundrae]